MAAVHQPRRGRSATSRVAVTIAAVAGAVATIAGLVAATSGAADASYARDIQPIFNRSCVTCHPSSYPYLDLRPGRSFHALVGVVSNINPAYELVLPGRPQFSFLLLHPPDPSDAMLLTGHERVLIARWIAQGAPDN
jgi:hypothetical protein